MKSTIVLVLGTLGVVVCLMAVLPWLMGTPGGNPDSAFARGWSMGLSVIVLYPIAFVSVALVRFLALRRAPEEVRADRERRFSNVILMLIGLATLGQLYAWLLLLEWIH